MAGTTRRRSADDPRQSNVFPVVLAVETDDTARRKCQQDGASRYWRPGGPAVGSDSCGGEHRRRMRRKRRASISVAASHWRCSHVGRAGDGSAGKAETGADRLEGEAGGSGRGRKPRTEGIRRARAEIASGVHLAEARKGRDVTAPTSARRGRASDRRQLVVVGWCESGRVGGEGQAASAAVATARCLSFVRTWNLSTANKVPVFRRGTVISRRWSRPRVRPTSPTSLPAGRCPIGTALCFVRTPRPAWSGE